MFVCLIDLICGHAGWGFKTADLVNADTFIADAAVQIFKNVSSKIFGGRVQLFVEGRKLVEISVVEIPDDLIGGLFQVDKVYKQADIVKFRAFCIDLDLVIVPVKILALALVPAKLVGA